jgi:hypothetical protein
MRYRSEAISIKTNSRTNGILNMLMSQQTVLMLGIYFAVIALLATLKPRYIPGRAIYLFRALFPSWRFYEDICEVPMLHFRWQNGTDTEEFATDWVPAWGAPERSWSALMLNPSGSFVFACQGLLNQVESDIDEIGTGEHQEFANSVSYRLLQKLVLHQMRKRPESRAARRYQFKLTAATQGEEQTGEDVLISAVHLIEASADA